MNDKDLDKEEIEKESKKEEIKINTIDTDNLDIEKVKTKEEIEKIKDFYKNLEGMTCSEIFKTVLNALKANITNVLILILAFIGVSILQELIATFIFEQGTFAWANMLLGEVQNESIFLAEEFFRYILIFLIMLLIEFTIIYIIASITKVFMQEFYYNKGKSSISEAYTNVKDRIIKYFLADIMYVVLSFGGLFLIYFILLKVASGNIFEFFGIAIVSIIALLIIYAYISLLFVLRGDLIVLSKTNIIESFKISRELVKGHKFDIFIMQLFITIGGYITDKLLGIMISNINIFNESYLNELNGIESVITRIPVIALSSTATIIFQMLLFGVISIKFFNILDIKGKDIKLKEKEISI